jgi:hypothetical protein|tara:strand:- start:435 stop:536 length:102 start_codon:yes stop_codon:yes gene_type:complete
MDELMIITSIIAPFVALTAVVLIIFYSGGNNGK